MSVIPLADLKAHLNKKTTSTSDDTELQATLDAAETYVAGVIGGPLGTGSGAGSRTFSVQATGRTLVLPATHLASVTSITSSAGETVDLTALTALDGINLLSGIIRLPYARSRGYWTVVATFPTALPADLKLAVLIIAGHLWETQRVAGQGGGSGAPGFGGDSAPVMGVGYAVPNRAETLLARYRQVVVA